MSINHLRGKRGLVATPVTVPLVVSLLLGACASIVGCASEETANADAEHVGSLGLDLEVAPGVTLLTVSYAITGNGFSKSGTIDVDSSPTISAVIGGIPAGNGYSIELSAVSAEDGSTFTGSATFNVTARDTTSVTVHLKGAGKSSKGAVSVAATLNTSPVIDELTATPTAVFVGGEVTLTGVANDPDGAPAALSYYWSTTGGLIDTPISPNAKLTSDTPGIFTVELTVSDGEITTKKSTTIQFVEREVSEGPGDTGPDKPNILYILIDDLGAEGIGVYPDLAGASGQVSVPNIEALAERGLVFDNAWASPVCSPTRGTVVSGSYGFRTGVTTVGDVLPTSTVTLFDRLTAESPSYDQGFFGKYHLGTSVQHVIDLGIPFFRGILGGGVSDYFSWTTSSTNAPAFTNTTYATTALTDYAVEFIQDHEAEKPDDPWFIYQAYNAPHGTGANSPFQVPPAELHSVDLSSVGSPVPGVHATNIPIYKANIQASDTEIGRLLADVDLETTTVIVQGDNGTPPPVKDTGTKLRNSKGSVYEGGVRVPLIIAGAGVTRRGREDDLFVASDIYATVLELSGLSVSHVNDSYSFKPLLTDEAATNGRTHSFSEVSNGTNNRRWAVKDKRYKLVFNLGTRELYDLALDPSETTNLYANPAYAAVLSTLEAEIAVFKAASPAYFP